MARPHPKRSEQTCPVRRTLDVIGDAWTVLVLRDLFVQGPRRYQDLQNSLAGISPNTLSDRLKRLEEHGVVERQFYSEHPPRAEYVLTSVGQSLGPILVAMRDWGRKNPSR
jgi:DNA-binding HxlR family transcriptional regulator